MSTPESNTPSTTTPPAATPAAPGAAAPATTPAAPTAPGAPRPFTPRPGGPRPYQGSRPYTPGGRPPGRPGERDFRGGPGGPRGRGRGPIRRKVCRFCAEKVFEVDYKQIHVVRSFMTARGKLLSGRTTGNCAKHQRQVAVAIKRAQNIALLPTMGE